MINIASGGRHRLSGILEALCILSFILFASGVIGAIPMAALVGVMLVVVCKTFAWSSLRLLHRIPRADAFVLVLVSVVTVVTNLATAVLVGVLVSCLVFAWESATRMDARRSLTPEGEAVYEIHGPLFFGSVRSFQEIFSPKDDPDQVALDFRHSRVHDHSALEAVHSIAGRYRDLGKTLHLRHLSPHCRLLLTKAGDTVDVEVSPERHVHVATERLRPEQADGSRGR
jgi:SulP family sulfate permease